MIQLGIWSGKSVLENPGGPSAVMKVFERGRGRQERQGMLLEDSNTADSEDGGRSPEIYVGSLWKLENARK